MVLLIHLYWLPIDRRPLDRCRRLFKVVKSRLMSEQMKSSDPTVNLRIEIQAAIELLAITDGDDGLRVSIGFLNDFIQAARFGIPRKAMDHPLSV